jgi:hypothetical protein
LRAANKVSVPVEGQHGNKVAATKIADYVSGVYIILNARIENCFRQTSTVLVNLLAFISSRVATHDAPLQEHLALRARLVWVFVWVPHSIAAHTWLRVPLAAAALALVAAALTSAACAATHALAPDFAGRNQQAVKHSEGTVYEEHAVSVLSAMERVEVSPG